MKRLRDLLTEAEIFAGGDKVKVKGGKHGRVLHATKTAGGIKYLVILSDGSENTYGANALTRVEDTFDDSDHQEREVFKGTPILNAHGSHAQPPKKPLNEENLFEQRKPTEPHRNQQTMEQKTDPHAFDIDHNKPVPEMHDHMEPDNQHLVKYDEKVHGEKNQGDGERKHGHAVITKMTEAHPHMRAHPGFDEMKKYTSSSHDMNGFLHGHYTAKLDGGKKFKKKEYETHEDHKQRMRHYKDEHKRNELKAMKLDKLGKDNPLAHDVTVYHGAGFDVEKAASADPERKLHAPSFLSTSTSKDVSRGFGMSHYDKKGNTVRHMLRIHLPKGHPSISAGDMSNCAGEHEIILARHTTLKVAKKPQIVKRWGEHVHVYDAHPVANELQNAPNAKRDKYEKSVQRGLNIANGTASEEEVHSALKDEDAHEEHNAIINHPEMLKKHKKAVFANVHNFTSSTRRNLGRAIGDNPKATATDLSKLLHHGIVHGISNENVNLGPQHLKGLIEHSGNENAISHIVANKDLSDDQFKHVLQSNYSHLAMASPKFGKKHINDAVEGLLAQDSYGQNGKVAALASNKNFTKKDFNKLTDNPEYAGMLVDHKFAGPELANKLAGSSSWNHRYTAAKSKHLSDENVAKLYADDDSDVRSAIRQYHGDKIDSNLISKALKSKNGSNVNTDDIHQLTPEHFKDVLDHYSKEDDDDTDQWNARSVMFNLMRHNEAKNHVDSFVNHPDSDVASRAIEKLPLQKHHVDKILADHDGSADENIAESKFFSDNPTHQHTLVDKALENGDYTSAKWWADQRGDTPKEMYRKIGQHFIDHGVHHEGATHDWAGQRQIEAIGQLAHHLTTEQVNALLKTGEGHSIAANMRWSQHDSRPMDQVFDGVSDKVKATMMLKTDSMTPNLNAHVYKDATPEQVAKSLGNSYMATSKFTPEQLKAGVDHIFSQDVSNHDSSQVGDEPNRRYQAMRMMKHVLTNQDLRKHVTQEHVDKMLDQFMTHKGDMTEPAEYATLEAGEHFKPAEDILNAVSEGQGPKEMVGHVYKHMSKEQAENWMNEGKRHMWTSEHFMNTFGKGFSPETLQNVIDDKEDRHYSWVKDRAKQLLAEKQTENNAGIKYRTPANPELG